jgi:hypothetical protein
MIVKEENDTDNLVFLSCSSPVPYWWWEVVMMGWGGGGGRGGEGGKWPNI